MISVATDSRTVEENWYIFKTGLLESVTKYVPQKVIRNQRSLPHDIKRCMKQRKRLYNQAKRSNKHEDWAAYHSARNEVNNKLELDHSDYCRKMFDEFFLATVDSFGSISRPSVKIQLEFLLYLWIVPWYLIHREKLMINFSQNLL